jgi:DNA-binding winged helix-turn-helix (wHTH) protein
MPLHQDTRSAFSFGPFEAYLQTEELRKHGVKLRLPKQSFQILAMLVQKPGQLVQREELQRTLWPSDTFVDFEQGLNAAVNRLRDTLGDSAENPRCVETLPSRGYRLIVEVRKPEAENSEAARDISLPATSERTSGFALSRRNVLLGGILACLVLVIAVVWVNVSSPAPIPRVVDSGQITNDATRKAGGNLRLLSDGPRVYFEEGPFNFATSWAAIARMPCCGVILKGGIS